MAENELKLNLFKLLPQPSHADEPREQSFEQVSADLDLLLYRRIRHRFECDGSLEWFEDTVLSYCTDSCEFTVQYDHEQELYSYTLLNDLEAEDLIVQ